MTPLPSFYALAEPSAPLDRTRLLGRKHSSVLYPLLPTPCSLPMRGPSLTLGWGSVTLAMENASKSAWSG